MAVWVNGEAKIVDIWGKNMCTIPTCAEFGQDDIFVGDSAIEQQLDNVDKTIFEAKRIIGRKYKAVARLCKYWPFDVVNKNSKPMYNIGDIENEEWLNPEEISAIILKCSKDAAKRFAQKKVKYILKTK